MFPYPFTITLWNFARILNLYHNLLDWCPMNIHVTIHIYLRSSHSLYWMLWILSLNYTPILSFFICLSFTNNHLVWYAMNIHMTFSFACCQALFVLVTLILFFTYIPIPSSHELSLMDLHVDSFIWAKIIHV